MRKRVPLDIPFPTGGLNNASTRRDQATRTTIACQNMRPYDARTGILRGAQRPGTVKYVSTQINSTARIQCLDHVATVQTGAGAASSLSIRTVTSIAVAGGTVKKFTSSAVSAVTNGTTALDTTIPMIFSTPLYGKIYFADGTNKKYYDPSTNTVSTWTESAGTLPIDSSNRPRLIETWRGRIVLAGIKTDPHNWFMSAVGDATNWDYVPAVEVETQAVAGNNSSAGKIGDTINSMIPYNDDVLVFGCDHSIWQMTGDPMAGGRVDLISDITGMAWGRPWCKGPAGEIYFFGSRGGVFRLAPGQSPERMTVGTVDEEMATIDLNAFAVRMEWNDRELGFHVFISPLAGGGIGYHYYYCARTKSWWKDLFAEPLHNPVATHVYDGDEAGDRALLLGSNDGYIRRWTTTANSDDGTAIDSFVMLGPLQIGDGFQSFVLTDLQSVLGDNSATVDFYVYAGNSAEHVFSDDNGNETVLDGFLMSDSAQLILTAETILSFSGTLAPVRSVCHQPRVRGNAVYVKLRNDNLDETWSFESLRCVAMVPESSRGRHA